MKVWVWMPPRGPNSERRGPPGASASSPRA
jgi:hypothetical protein